MKKSLLFLSLVSSISLAAQQPQIELTFAQVGAIGHVVGEVVRTTIEYSLKGPGLVATLTAAGIPLSLQQSAAIITGDLTIADICLPRSIFARAAVAVLAVGAGVGIGYKLGRFMGRLIPIPFAGKIMGVGGGLASGLVMYGLLCKSGL